MKIFLSYLFVTVVSQVAVIGAVVNSKKSTLKDTNAKYINPILGTAGAVDIGGYGGTIPSTSTPFAMTHFTAMTQENYVSACPYIYWQNTFYGFLASHQPAKWMVSFACLFVLTWVYSPSNHHRVNQVK